MAEKRKPVLTMLLRFQGNTKASKLEFFRASDFGLEKNLHEKYRLRKDGKWWPKDTKQFLSISRVKELVFRSIYARIR